MTLSTGDAVSSYFGMRTVEMGREDSGRPCVLLNGEILKFQVGFSHVSHVSKPGSFHKSPKPWILDEDDIITQVGPLDQGYWPDGLLTPPTEEAIRQGISLGQNIKKSSPWTPSIP